MIEFNLSWGTGRSGKKTGGTLKRPSWSDIELRLETANTETGSVTLDILDAADIGPQGLDVFCESGEYAVMLGECTEDDHDVRTPKNPKMKNDSLHRWTLAGFPAHCMCTDFSFVKRVFKDFFETGDVSHDLLA